MGSLDSMSAGSRRPLARRDVGVALVADVVCVVGFAAVGRVSHGEDLGPVGLARTAWPFLTGCMFGSLVAAVRGLPRSLRSGVVVWLTTVLVGMLLRALTHAGVQVSFVVVALVVLGLAMVGWRAVRRLTARVRTSRAGTRHGRSARLS